MGNSHHVKETAKLVADADRLGMLVVPTESLDIEPGRGLYHCERVEADRTASGLHIPEQAQEKHMARWRVLAVGPGLIDVGIACEPLYARGDEVWLCPGTGTLVEVPGARAQVLCAESCVIARVTPRPQ